MGRRQTALPPEKSILFFDHLPISTFVRPDSSEHSVRFQPENMFFYGGVYLSVRKNLLSLQCHLCIFLLFVSFCNLFAGFSFFLLEFILLPSIINDPQKFICKLAICNFYNTIFSCRVSKNINAAIPNSGFVYDT